MHTKRRRSIRFALALGALLALAADARAVTMAWSRVGNPGNAADPATGSHYGAVPYSYNIGTYDVTNSQYVAFLNSNDPTGANTLGLYNGAMSDSGSNGFINYNSGSANGSKYSVVSGDGNLPIVNESWYDAIRFANWLDNGQTPGSTEMGAYTLLGGTPTPSNAVTRNASATIFLPSENEWYKAAYYNPATSSYYQYATSSNAAPTASAPTATPNSANTNNIVGHLTDVGAYTGTTSPYGAFDMGGNVWQWNEALLGLYGIIRGGSFDEDGAFGISSGDRGISPLNLGDGVGFRVASVPEPSTLILAALGGVVLLLRGCRCRNVAPALLALAMFAPDARAQVTMAWSPVGNPGNAPDKNFLGMGAFGAVAYNYRIGTYDVTNSQYVEFLNSNVPNGETADPLALYNSDMSNATYGGIAYNSGAASGSKYSVMGSNGQNPVNYVTWYDALRFANWLDNGQAPGSTETGAYTLLGGTPTPSNDSPADPITRNAGATIFLPNEDEWYKAAYYNPATKSYFPYPTSSDAAPTAISPTSTPNSANLYPGVGALTNVGAYTETTSPYGAYDMAGDVREWDETLISGSFRGLRGGSYRQEADAAFALWRDYDNPYDEFNDMGFRVASVPEPSTLILAALGFALLAWRRAVRSRA
jgi:formylglycine-generating enzyme required for sulfatase activity